MNIVNTQDSPSKTRTFFGNFFGNAGTHRQFVAPGHAHDQTDPAPIAAADPGRPGRVQHPNREKHHGHSAGFQQYRHSRDGTAGCRHWHL